MNLQYVPSYYTCTYSIWIDTIGDGFVSLVQQQVNSRMRMKRMLLSIYQEWNPTGCLGSLSPILKMAACRLRKPCRIRRCFMSRSWSQNTDNVLTTTTSTSSTASINNRRFRFIPTFFFDLTLSALLWFDSVCRIMDCCCGLLKMWIAEWHTRNRPAGKSFEIRLLLTTSWCFTSTTILVRSSEAFFSSNLPTTNCINLYIEEGTWNIFCRWIDMLVTDHVSFWWKQSKCRTTD